MTLEICLIFTGTRLVQGKVDLTRVPRGKMCFVFCAGGNDDLSFLLEIFWCIDPQTFFARGGHEQ